MTKVLRPKSVNIAINILWVMMFVSVAHSMIYFTTYVEMSNESAGIELPIGAHMASIAVSLLINALFIFFISRGKKWARLSFAVMVVFAWIGTFSLDIATLISLTSITVASFESVAVILLYRKEAQDWINS